MSAEPVTTRGTKTYNLTCTDCQFEATVNGDCYEVLDLIDAHQAEHEGDAFDHFVNFELVGGIGPTIR